MKNRVLMFFLIFLSALSSKAQETEPEMADVFRQNGKIYVVVAIILVVLAGFFTYLIILDRKIRQIEKKVEDK